MAAGLIYLYLRPTQTIPATSSSPSFIRTWSPPFRATLPVAIFFLLSNVFLVIAPFVPPTDDQNVYESLPYYLHCVVGIGIFVVGAAYWVIWAQVLPRIGGYRLERLEGVASDGWGNARFQKVREAKS